LMKSRRCIAAQGSGVRPIPVNYIRDLRLAKWGSELSVHGSNPEPLMSASGQKQTFRCARVMSALPPKADIRPRDQDVCFGPLPKVQHYSKTSTAPIRSRKLWPEK
jgi:hypothetical protein